MKLFLDPESITSALSTLAAKDRSGCVFGSDSHKYKLNPPLDEDIVASFERQHAITLPSDYRRFITTIGNGGAGPAYGLFRFGEHDDGYSCCSWDGGYLVGAFGNPFPHESAWNHTDDFWSKRPEITDEMAEEQEDQLWEEWDKLLEAEYWNCSVVDGAIPICHLGCAYRQWLVVHGPQRGFVWNDDRADERGLSPVLNSDDSHSTFTDWYLGWLGESLTQMKVPLDNTG
ncbi:MAG: SMI1/KNR4 family protein [Pirellulales bacterium]|nr:SMI1/KNR4 family protein [Pirellulales bacterium]